MTAVEPLLSTSPLDSLAIGLSRQLDERAPVVKKMQDQYDSQNLALSFVAPEVAATTQNRLQTLTLPWGRIVIDVLQERLTVTGFRSGGSDNTELWDLWQSQDLDEWSSHAHTSALVAGSGFLLVWADDAGNPRITVESPRLCLVTYHPGTRRVKFGIKRWSDGEVGHLVLFSEYRVHRFRTAGRVIGETDMALSPANWVHTKSTPNPLGVVPLIPVVNRPSLDRPEGLSELADLVPILNGLSKLATDLMVSSEYSAMPRRWVTGIQIPEKLDEQGQPTGELDTSGMFDQLASRVWAVEDATAQMGQFPEATMSGFTGAIDALLKQLSAFAALPPQYAAMLPTSNPSSADAIRAAESALVRKAVSKQRSFEGAWEQALRLALAIKIGHFDPAMQKLEVSWADPGTNSVAQQADAATKLVQSGILSWQGALESLGYSREAIAEEAKRRRATAIDQAALKALRP
jgi:hypothetical protein